MLFRSISLLLVASFACGQHDELDQLIAEIFNDSAGSTTQKTTGGGGLINHTPSKEQTEPLSGTGCDCTCVPYYFFKNNTIIKKSNGLIDIRRTLTSLLLLASHNCGQDDDLDQLIAQIYSLPADSTTQKTIGGGGNINPTPVREEVEPIPATEDNCTCVPYFLCKKNTINKDGNGLIDIRKTEGGSCENYFEICCGDEDKLERAILPTPAQGPLGCGWRNPEGVGFRISHAFDNEAAFAEFPWMVAVLREVEVKNSANTLNVYQCGGSLIHPKAVLTAAHCVTGKNLGKTFKIRAGEWDTQTTNEIYPHQDRDVETVIIHDHYSNITLFNDIALLILKEPVEITENVNIVCLPPANQVIDNPDCFASGWGKDVFGKEGKYQVILKKVELPMVLHEKCQERLRKTKLGDHFYLHESFACAGGVPGKDTCKGDGGSPLVCPIPGQKERYHLTGIVAWGIGCGETANPGVYANVAHLRKWVDERMVYQGLDYATYNY